MLGKFLGTGSVLLLVLFIFSIGHGSALPAQNIGVSPAITTKTLNPGSLTSDSLNISNSGVQGYNYTIYASPYGVQSATYQPVFKKLPGFTDIASWITFSSSSGYLSPGANIQISYKIIVPSGTPPGSYYAAIFAQTGASVNQDKNKAQLNFQQRIGSLLYINVSGKAYQNGTVYSWTVPFFQSSNVYGNLKLKNTGKLYFVSTVNANFEDVLGNIKYQYQTQKIVIPQVIRNVQVAWPKPPSFGLFKVNGTTTVYGQKYLNSRYVLIVSPTARLVCICILVSIIMYLSIYNVLINVFKDRGNDKK